MSTLEIRGLRAAVGDKEILKGIDLTISSGEVHAVMGPNGAGKSTLSGVVMGKPGYEVLGGSVTLDGVDVLALAAWERAAAGLHLIMQYPTEVPGVMLAVGRPTTSSNCFVTRPPASGSTSVSCTARSTSTCRAARRSATRPSSWRCSRRRSRSSMNSTQDSTSMRCAIARDGSKR